MTELEFDYTPTIRDAYVGGLVFAISSPYYLVLNSLFPIAGLTVIALAIMTDRFTLSTLATGMLGVFFTPILLTIVIAKQRFQQRGMSLNQHFKISDDGIACATESWKSDFKWNSVKSLRETCGYFVFRLKVIPGFVLPKAIFRPEQLSFLRKIAAKNLEGHVALHAT